MTIYTKSVTQHVSAIFSLSTTEICILNDYGKNGPLSRNSINLVDSKKRQAARQIDKLFEDGYLHLIKKTPYRNKKKFLKLFGLSLKGFFLSLNDQKIDENYLFKQFILLFPDDLKIPIIKFLRLSIAEFILYHKSIGLKIESITDLSKYTKEIIYDYDLIVNKNDIMLLQKIHNDMIIIDDIRDILRDYETFDGEESEDGSFSHSGLDDFEISFIEDTLESEKNYSTKEHIKYEFLINFWPYVIDELGKGTDIEHELENISDDIPPFGLSEYEEDFKEFTSQKSSMFMVQWQLRKLDYTKSYSLSF